MNPITLVTRFLGSKDRANTDQNNPDALPDAKLGLVERCRPSQIRQMVQDRKERQKKQQLRAAYALNLCTTSLSQIVDYNDIIVLQQEYNAILNNLNMERMPKDEALLDALKRILDTCHYYIQYSKDKEMLAKMREGRLRRALTDSLGGGNIFVSAGGNPIAAASMIVAAIGITAVKYKSQKEKVREEFELKEWELEKAAQDQLHNLRRTLFETAWRMSAKYKFRDEYRLSESQIESYNKAIADMDPLSRFERLDLLRGSAVDWSRVKTQDVGEGIFAAYPMYWYYLARAALEVAEIYRPRGEYPAVGVGDSTRMKPVIVDENRDPDIKKYDKYRLIARKALGLFVAQYDDFRLLREDEVAAGAYLDYASFANGNGCVEDGSPRAIDCLIKAQTLAGANMEIIQSCAIGYLRLYYMDGLGASEKSDARDRAMFCLRMLVNDGYNLELNAKALSKFYRELGSEWQPQYQLMFDCVANKHPFPYRWIEPFGKDEFEKFWGRFEKNGLKRLLANYLDGRIRLIYSDFFQTVVAAQGEENWSSVFEVLSKAGWNRSAKYEGSEIKYEEDDPKQLLSSEILFESAQDSIDLAKSLKVKGVTKLLLGCAAPTSIAAIKLAAGAVHLQRTWQQFDQIAKRWLNQKVEGDAFIKVFSETFGRKLKNEREVQAKLCAMINEIAKFVGNAKTSKFIFFSACSESFDKEVVECLLGDIEKKLHDFVSLQASLACDALQSAVLEWEQLVYQGSCGELGIQGAQGGIKIGFVGWLEEQAEGMKNSIRKMGFAGADFEYPKYRFETPTVGDDGSADSD